MAKKQTLVYQDGDFVVYPTHGVGKIIGTETSEIAGQTIQLLVIRFEQDRMTLRVPLEKAMTLGLRTLSSRKHMDDAITTLQSKAKVRRTMWSRRAQEYQAEQSYSERQMYQAALERLAREFAAIENIDQDSAATKIENLMDAA